MMNINMRAIYSKQLSFFGTRGMPSWKYPTLLEMIEKGKIDLSPMVDREIALSQASAEPTYDERRYPAWNRCNHKI